MWYLLKAQNGLIIFMAKKDIRFCIDIESVHRSDSEMSDLFLLKSRDFICTNGRTSTPLVRRGVLFSWSRITTHCFQSMSHIYLCYRNPCDRWSCQFSYRQSSDWFRDFFLFVFCSQPSPLCDFKKVYKTSNAMLTKYHIKNTIAKAAEVKARAAIAAITILKMPKTLAAETEGLKPNDGFSVPRVAIILCNFI